MWRKKKAPGEGGVEKLSSFEESGQGAITLRGAPADSSHPAHIHEGSCTALGAVKYPLTPVVNGSSETILDVSIEQLFNELPLAINVHKCQEELGVYIACGDLSAESAMVQRLNVHTVEINSDGFSPSSLTIRAGDTVTFVNNDTTQHWPASDVHPTHTLCPGFDALRGLNPTETYSRTFTEAGTCPMHDHLFPTLEGEITIR